MIDNFPKRNLHLGGFLDHVTKPLDDTGENRRGLLLRLGTATAGVSRIRMAWPRLLATGRPSCNHFGRLVDDS